MLRRLEEKGATNSRRTLSKYLKELEARQIVKREVIRAKPPKLVKLFKDLKRVQEDILKKQVENFQERINPLPMDSSALIANAFREMADSQAKIFQMPQQRMEETTAPLAEVFARLSQITEIYTQPFREMQELIEKTSKGIMQLHALSEEIEEAIKAGKLDPDVRNLPFPDAIRNSNNSRLQTNDITLQTGQQGVDV